MVMPALARDFQVVAVDHQRFALVGHDTGIIVRGREDIFFGAEYAASAWKDDNPVLARIGPATGKALAQFAAADGGRPARERRPRRLLDLWPAIYFADARGLIRHHHFGEGEYQQSEMVIQQLLAEAGSAGAGHEQVSVDARGAEAPADWATDWTMEDQATTLNTANGRIAYRFHARDLHLVMGPAVQGTSARFRVLIDGQPPGAAHGVDVDDQGSG